MIATGYELERPCEIPQDKQVVEWTERVLLLHSQVYEKQQHGKKSRYKHLGKAGSQADLEAVRQIVRRACVDGLQQAINTLKAGWEDLCVREARRSLEEIKSRDHGSQS